AAFFRPAEDGVRSECAEANSAHRSMARHVSGSARRPFGSTSRSVKVREGAARMRRALTSFLMAAVVVVMPVTAESGAWFGTPLPPAVSDPRKPVMKYDDVFAPLPVHFAPRPGRHDELLDGAALKKDQQKIVGFSLESLGAGDKVWGRRAATPSFM